MAVVSLKAERLDRLATRVNAAHAKANEAAASVIRYAVEAGKLLIQAKDSLPHGDFGRWLDRNVDVSHRMARNYMRLAKALSEMSESKRQRVAEMPLREALRVIVGPGKPEQHFSAHEEWYTPGALLERVRAVLGDIDLDPASCAEAQRTVQARRFYTVAQNGLDQGWRGKVFLNPPFTKEKIALFVNKLIAECDAGNVPEAILLVNSYTDTTWFHAIVQHAAAICFTRSRIKFVGSNAQKANPPYGQAFAYFGNRGHRFKKEFAPVGSIVLPTV